MTAVDDVLARTGDEIWAAHLRGLDPYTAGDLDHYLSALRGRISAEVEEVRHLFWEGRPFFDEIDERMRTRYAGEAVALARSLWGDQYLVTSGRFGEHIESVIGPGRVLRFPGGLRHADPPPMEIPSGRSYAFVDDSCYRGRTFGRVRRAIEAAGSRVIGGVVLYDGAATPLPGLVTVYRWRERIAPAGEASQRGERTAV